LIKIVFKTSYFNDLLAGTAGPGLSLRVKELKTLARTPFLESVIFSSFAVFENKDLKFPSFFSWIVLQELTLVSF